MVHKKNTPVKPKHIKTDNSFSKNDSAVMLADNHAFTEIEYTDFEQGLETVAKCLGITRREDIDFSKTEERLGISLPKRRT